ncbi:MAG: DUF4352 domain-containing protein [Ruminococcus sp.]|nr:DUF4352 domain-containing protein [Ruminococcus sp.]
MKKLKVVAVILAMSLAAVSAFSCSDKTTGNSNPNADISYIDPNQPVQEEPTKYSGGANKTNSDFGQEIEVNSTAFTLNSAVKVHDDQTGNDYMYINVTIKNKTDIEYEISSLNNFFVALDDSKEISSDVRTKIYALRNFPKCNDDYITIPANGEFTGFLAGGFIIPEGTDSFTVGFFPTLDNETNKSEVILAPVSAENISTDDSVLK